MNASTVKEEMQLKSYKTGYLPVECVKDEMRTRADKHGKNKNDYSTSSGVSVVFYGDVVPVEDQSEMTHEICFSFCRSIKGAHFFGLHNGRNCYCAPFYKAEAGDSSECDAPCGGDSKEMCGGQTKSKIFAMHKCDEADQAKKQAAQVEVMEGVSKSCEELSEGLKQYQKFMDETGKAAKEQGGKNGDMVASENGVALSGYGVDLEAAVIAVDTSCGDLIKEVGVMKEVHGRQSTDLEDAVAFDEAEKNAEAGVKVFEGHDKKWNFVLGRNASELEDLKKKDEETMKAYFPITYWIQGKQTWNVSDAEKAVYSSCRGDSAADPLKVDSYAECASACFQNSAECVAFQTIKTQNAFSCQQLKRVEEVSYFSGKEEEGGCTQDAGRLTCFHSFSAGASLGLRFSSKDAEADHIKQQNLRRCFAP